MKMTSSIYAREIIDSEFSKKKIIISQRDKNLNFMKKYSITYSEAKEIIRSLTANHFVEKIINKDKSIPSNYLYIFKVYLQLNDEYGINIEHIYIKICKINEGLFVVSFHDDE